MLLSIGIVTSIVAQALFNISVVLSLVPTKGIPLPFISYGGSSLVPTLAAVGILLNVSQHASGNISDFRLPIADLAKVYKGRPNRQSAIGNWQ
jgi:cell division protein FtsW (lipid II flippase)